MRRSSQRGVALVVTLIMLSVITVLVITFLAVARRERSAVSQSTYTATAKVMADAAYERARALVLSQVISTTNLLEPDLAVSRNYINPLGFTPGVKNATNVNFEYRTSGAALSGFDHVENVANLLLDPRPPVYINTNRLSPARIDDFRYYLDLNRNRLFEDTGMVDGTARQTLDPLLGEYQVGDPQWIGVLENPMLPHARNNPFVGRYAFVVQPVGKVLDINWMHNHAKNAVPFGTGSGFYRNQGFGTWEINLAAFLADLNTNVWNPPTTPTPVSGQYRFDTSPMAANLGAAFYAAQGLLTYRYNGFLAASNLPPAIDLLPYTPVTSHPFFLDLVDNYANGPLFSPTQSVMTFPGEQAPYADDPRNPWPGSGGTNHFYTVHDFYRPSLSNPRGNPYVAFTNSLMLASLRNNNYDRYTYYRMLAQLGSESGAEPPQADIPALRAKISANFPPDFPSEPVGKININYDNLAEGGTNYSATNLLAWYPNKFFTNVANVLLRAHFPFGLGTNGIPVYPTNYYTPSVHRLLQLAANIHDATTNDYAPSVFRPIFYQDALNNVFITSYTNDNDARTVNALPNNETYGIPFVLGAKKGIPNFNEFLSQTYVQAARKLEVAREPRLDTNQPIKLLMTNEMFMLSISNLFALESWNSYTQEFRLLPWTLQVRSDVTFLLVTNRNMTNPIFRAFHTNLAAVDSTMVPRWFGYNPSSVSGGFLLPLYTNVLVLTNGVYRAKPFPHFEQVGTNRFETNLNYVNLEWGLVISNRLTYVLSSNDRILDYVHLRNLNSYVDITGQLMGLSGLPGENADIASCWRTNLVGNGANGLTEGVVNQVAISLGSTTVGFTDWANFALNPLSIEDTKKGIDRFRAFFGMVPLYDTNVHDNLVVSMQAPFAPTRKMAVRTSWQANDPMIHHMVEHLKDATNNTEVAWIRSQEAFLGGMNITNLNTRYKPWRGNPNRDYTSGADMNMANLAVKDPGVMKSDDWDFPINKFPTIGWLGRVHRGTPWQTVYLKSQAATPEEWQHHFLDPYPGTLSHPTNDWRLIDMFTVAIHPNASRGQLSINQTNIAAWSAVLSGVVVLSNKPIVDVTWPNTNFVNVVIEPSTPAVYDIVTNILRAKLAQPGQTFRRLGDLLRVPQLSVESPFMDRSDLDWPLYGTTDALYERLPQQILSLLKVGDARYVIYAFGQSLRPAENSIVTSGPNVGICTNYAITGESAVRAVLRLEGGGRNPRPVIESFNLLPVE